jgi:hypothetical protein
MGIMTDQTAQYLNIEVKHRQMTGFLGSLADFTVTDGDAAHPDVILSNPNLSLYCFDDANKRAIFVEIPGDVNLATAPFVYQTQYEQAQRLLAIPYDIVIQLARRLPEVEHLIVMYITGRSGSTLVSHVLNQLETVFSLAEPDVATQFVHLRSKNGHRDAELRELLDSAIRILFRPTPYKTPTIYAVKLRNEGLKVMDLFQSTFPRAKNLFLYRDTFGFVRSFYRIFKRAEMPEYQPLDEFMAFFARLFNGGFEHLTIYLDENTDQISIPQQLTLWWIDSMEWYLAQYARGIPILAIDYADLNAAREQVLDGIFRHCDLPAEHITNALKVFDYDSQAGTFSGRDNPAEGNTLRLTDAQHDDVTRILQRHPIFKDSDFVLPGKLEI